MLRRSYLEQVVVEGFLGVRRVVLLQLQQVSSQFPQNSIALLAFLGRCDHPQPLRVVLRLHAQQEVQNQSVEVVLGEFQRTPDQGDIFGEAAFY